jgi:hypothetical protein
MLHGISTDLFQLMIAHCPLVSRANALGHKNSKVVKQTQKIMEHYRPKYELQTAFYIHPLRVRDTRNVNNHIDNLFSGHFGISIICANRNTTAYPIISLQVPSN